ncbi:bifunctional tetrahydrofolate synthase/dihydrofolate synthase [Candidatus Pantoea carbekii]|uniref:bifunctional tetrahydrofolate synthase/dihydrofolate synthase n=1 Tax=Candidatus Pantoea carbekii TaxID=1235990 RepID=UPI0006187BE9|nr:bifunctional tetrahydrofolate synthase/dihydrofolate synthase [Candidatus Pantoea carbekii]AKC31987.1 bifunctional folylpolyglutamate synthase_ dihydrofolate synthase [Candidatus Pantoea carbekii]
MGNFYSPNASWSLANWLDYIEHLHFKTIDLSLDRVQLVAEKLNLLRPAPYVFIVSGTNGKGTTCRALEIFLLAAGYRVGVYSSPHLVRYTERVRIQGIELDETLHIASLTTIENNRNNISLSYFEFSTLSALNLFCKSNLEVVIMEVGLGGRLDATNIVDADIALITSIGLDHTEYLGADRQSIGREKAGIFRANKPAIVGEVDMPISVAEIAAEKSAILLQRNRDWNCEQEDDSTWVLRDLYGEISGLSLTQIPLSNAATALVALRESRLNVSEEIIRHYLPLIKLPGRFQNIKQFPRVILDVAHNPQAANYLASRLVPEINSGKVHAVVGILRDKDIFGVLSPLIKKVDYWYCATLEGPRGTLAKELLMSLKLMHQTNNTKIFNNVKEAWEMARFQSHPQDIILVFGSFQTVAQVLQFMEAENYL